MFNTQRGNENAILTSEKLDKLDALAENLKDLKIKDSEYYVSDSVNSNDTKDDPARNLKTVTHTTDKKNRKVTETRNVIF